ncbi:HpcH/HpaI aldolase/citrate lyase family protein [Peribacillus sp. TH14]|uniref:HpcH/HpaI aldolase/citrate lyase family protein n=1 Tax=Peribacillus sp. TH14 TaxID=2798481 RepID=UPI00237A2857|nr:CoA ester lyase [Peribacillus sp. TH14]
MRNHFLRRSLLYVPGSSLKMMNRALEMEVDSVIFDLEDAVSFSEKVEARKSISEFIATAKQTNKEVIVRTNPIDTYLGIMDLMAIVPKGPHTLVIPKASVKSILTADVIITAIEAELGWGKNTIKLIPLIETADGITNVDEIVSVAKRIDGVHLGGEDLTNELGVTRTKIGDELLYARNKVVFAAKAFELDAIDCPYVDFKDTEGLTFDINRAKSLGMTGKVCIHPGQIETINNTFSPREEEIKEAVTIIESYEKAIQNGIGVYSLNGKMIDAPIVERAKNLINKMEKITKNQ